ncbi:MAG: hypothetical protein ACI4CY_02735 [Candidatus Gastranaerophilaceae bacterium]
MQNYNLKQIMKRAWAIKRKSGSDFSTALKNSWKIAKFEKETFEKYDLVKGEDVMTFRVWVGYSHVRAYYTRSWVSNYQNNKKTNFIELAA